MQYLLPVNATDRDNSLFTIFQTSSIFSIILPSELEWPLCIWRCLNPTKIWRVCPLITD